MGAVDPQAASGMEDNKKAEEVMWLRRFFWYRGVLRDIDFAVLKAQELATDTPRTWIDSMAPSPEQSPRDLALRHAAMATIRTLNALETHRRWLEAETRKRLATVGEQAQETQMQNAEEAKIIVLEVFVYALKNLNTYRLLGGWTRKSPEERNVQSRWLRKILSNYLKDTNQKSRIRPPLSFSLPINIFPDAQDDMTLGDVIASPKDDMAEVLAAETISSFLRIAEANPTAFRLQKYDSRIARAQWLQGLTLEAIANKEGVTAATASNAVKRVRKQLHLWLSLHSTLLDPEDTQKAKGKKLTDF